MLDNYQDLLDELLGTPAVVRKALGGTPGAEMLRLIAAMRARDRLVLARTQRIKEQIDPYLKPVPEFDELIAGEALSDVSELVSSFETARGDLVSLLMNLTLRDWERTATTDADGVITLADEIEMHVEFDEQQRARLEALTGA